MQSLEEIRNFFDDDLFAKSLGITIDSAELGAAVCSVELTKNHLNALGSAQGGLIFTLADLAFAAAANFGRGRVVTLESSVNFIALGKGSRLTAKATAISHGKHICVYDVPITDEKGTKIAHAIFTGYVMKPFE